jgi:hypothetical protein
VAYNVHSKANEYARNHGLRQFSVYQGKWSAADRDFERDIIHMARDEGMALAPWGALGGGAFKSAEQRKASEGRKVKASQKQIKISEALEAIAKRKNTIITSVAMAYVMHKTPYVFPIVGGRTVDHLKQNIEALTLDLSDEDLAEIDGAWEFDPGFPNSMLYAKPNIRKPNDIWLLGMGGVYDYVELPKVCSVLASLLTLPLFRSIADSDFTNSPSRLSNAVSSGSVYRILDSGGVQQTFDETFSCEAARVSRCVGTWMESDVLFSPVQIQNHLCKTIALSSFEDRRSNADVKCVPGSLMG